MTRRKTITDQPRRVAGYARVSKRRDDQTSTRTQRQAMTRYIDDKGWTLVEICEDDGRSAYKTGVRRPGLDRAMELVRSGAADCLMVWKLDRFVRSSKDFGDRWAVLAAADAEFVSITDNFDTTTAMGRAMLQIAVVFAELESAIKGERILEWQDDRLTLGATPTGPRPYGYRRARNQLIVDEAEARVIRDAATAVLEGIPLRQIVRDLEVAGVLRHDTDADGRPTTKVLSRRALAAILTGPTIAGCREVEAGVFVEARRPGADEPTWPAILERDQWDEVRAVLLDPSRRSGPGNGRRWLLSGIATCGRCTALMGAKPHAAGPRYACPVCHLSIEIERTDEVVERDLLAMLSPDVWRRLRAGRPLEDDGPSDFDAALAALSARFADDELDPLEFAELAEGLRRRRDAGAAPVPQLPDVADLPKAWRSGRLTLEQRRLVVAVATESLVIEPWRPGVNRFDETRVVWTPVP